MQRVGLGREIDAARIAAAALVAQLFAVYLVMMRFIAPATEAHWQRADPILLIVGRDVTLLAVPVFSVAVAVLWCAKAKPRREHMMEAVRHAVLGVIVCVAVVALVRAIAGAHLPSFIPAEESAGPGYLLSMTAGYGEEVVIRLLLLPAVYLLCAGKVPRIAAILLAIAVSAIAFALWHEAGPGPSSLHYAVTRTLVPGAAMSAAFFLIGPSFIVAAHGTAHLLIPALFL